MMQVCKTRESVNVVCFFLFYFMDRNRMVGEWEWQVARWTSSCDLKALSWFEGVIAVRVIGVAIIRGWESWPG